MSDMSAPSPTKSGLLGSPWLTLTAVALGVIMVGIDGSVVAVANPYIGKSFHASLADLQWVTNSYLLVIAVTLILGGKLGDRFGRRRMFLTGVVGFAASSLAIGFAGDINMVIALRCVQGAFGALLLPNTLALLKAAFPGDKLNRAVGIWVSASAAATASGPIVGGILVEHLSWRSVFFVNVPIGTLAFVIGMLTLAESREAVLARFDIPGVLTLAAGLSAVVYGLVKAQSWGWGSGETWLLVGFGLVLLAIFVVIESHVSHPLVPMEIFRIRAVSASTAIVLLNFFALFGVLFFVSLYLQSVHGFSPTGAGLRLLPLTITFAFSGPIGSRLVERFGAWVPITVGLLLTSVALYSLSSLQVDSSYIHLWPPFILIGLGIGFRRYGGDRLHRRSGLRRRGGRGRGDTDNLHPAGRGPRHGDLRFHSLHLGDPGAAVRPGVAWGAERTGPSALHPWHHGLPRPGAHPGGHPSPHRCSHHAGKPCSLHVGPSHDDARGIPRRSRRGGPRASGEVERRPRAVPRGRCWCRAVLRGSHRPLLELNARGACVGGYMQCATRAPS
jgi:EmrB/QacA subfamily drug resistance transporter